MCDATCATPEPTGGTCGAIAGICGGTSTRRPTARSRTQPGSRGEGVEPPVVPPRHPVERQAEEQGRAGVCPRLADRAHAGEPPPARLTHHTPGVGEHRIERDDRSEEHTSELQSQSNLVCRLLLEKKKNRQKN